MPANRIVVSLSAASVALAFVALGAMSGCQSSRPMHTGRQTSSFDVAMTTVSEADFAQHHQFYYFPSSEIYRDCDENRWLWSEDGGLTWMSASTLPAERDPGDEIPFAVFLTLNEPAMEHRAIAAAYPRESMFAPGTATVQGSSDFER